MKKKEEEKAMLQERPACIIKDYSALQKEMKKNRQTKEQRDKIAHSIANINSGHLRKVCSDK